MAKTSVLIFLVILALTFTEYLMALLLPADAASVMVTILGALGIIAAATAVTMRKRSVRNRKDAADSIESDLAVRARAAVMLDVLIAALLLGFVTISVRDIPAALVIFLLLVVMALDFWLRYGLALRRSRREG